MDTKEWISKKVLNRFDSLQTILKTGKATKKEQEEFKDLLEFIERKEAEKLKYMLSLAERLQLTMPQLRKKMGITSPE